MNVDRNYSVPSELEVDTRSIESFESFDEAYDRMVEETQAQQDDVSNQTENACNQVRDAHTAVGPVLNISEEFLEKGGGLHNVL